MSRATLGLFLIVSTTACYAPAPRPAWAPENRVASAEKTFTQKPPETPEEQKSYLIPAGEIVGFEILLNQFDRHFNDVAVFSSDFSSIRHNLGSGWVIDDDSLVQNQFGHPYQGTLYYGFARSAGLNFWESMGYSFAGSALWEIAGETDPPSINDQIATGIGGAFLGEPLFRMANWLLEQGGERPSESRQLFAAAIAPSVAVNRYLFPSRFGAPYPSRDPAVYTELSLGDKINTHIDDQGVPSKNKIGHLGAEFSMSYGLPGQPGYEYRDPFDYFEFDVSMNSTTRSTIENLTSRGLLIGESYKGEGYRGIWGFYGSYDYISPQDFRVASTAVSLGTTLQAWLSEDTALQGSLLGGLGFGVAGPIQNKRGEPDRHYGLTPQALLTLRLILGDVAVLELRGREYYISGWAADNSDNSQNVTRGEIAATFRVYGRHALTLEYTQSHRDARYESFSDRHQTVGSISLFYSLINRENFGAVEWRDKPNTERK